MNTVLLNQMIVIISQSFNECFSNDEQAIIGAFLTTLGDMLSLNSAYISYLQDQNSLSKQNQNDYDLLEKSIEKIKVELNKMKSNVQKRTLLLLIINTLMWGICRIINSFKSIAYIFIVFNNSR